MRAILPHKRVVLFSGRFAVDVSLPVWNRPLLTAQHASVRQAINTTPNVVQGLSFLFVGDPGLSNFLVSKVENPKIFRQRSA